ncbi:pseudouridine synthase, partial [Staphylococcus aureus]|uniref:pseudouridine synthase n=1 Tax=Staphylococcus aureus TaxID=1280 RepID=UPI001022FA72
VLGYFKQSGQNIVPHIVTRIDRNTSGIVVIATHGFLHHLMSNIHLDKTYLFVCYGELRSLGLIDAPIARDPASIITRQVHSNGKQAKTKYRCLD